jgi:hypothetical protein
MGGPAERVGFRDDRVRHTPVMQAVSSCLESKQTSGSDEPLTATNIPGEIGIEPFEQAGLLQNQRDGIRPTSTHLSDEKAHLRDS